MTIDPNTILTLLAIIGIWVRFERRMTTVETTLKLLVTPKVGEN